MEVTFLTRIKIFIVAFVFAVSFIICSPTTDCLVADSVSLVKKIKMGELDQYIYLRISGLHEKEGFYELYDKQPVFDACGKSTLPSKADVHIDSTRGAISKLVVNKERLSIVYHKGQTQKVDYKDVSLEVSAPKTR